MPKNYNSDQDHHLDVESLEYLNWEQHNQLLVSWLLASMNATYINQMVQCEFLIMLGIELKFISLL